MTDSIDPKAAAEAITKWREEKLEQTLERERALRRAKREAKAKAAKS